VDEIIVAPNRVQLRSPDNVILKPPVPWSADFLLGLINHQLLKNVSASFSDHIASAGTMFGEELIRRNFR
jgi:hypothetical protein